MNDSPKRVSDGTTAVKMAVAGKIAFGVERFESHPGLGFKSGDDIGCLKNTRIFCMGYYTMLWIGMLKVNYRFQISNHHSMEIFRSLPVLSSRELSWYLVPW